MTTPPPPVLTVHHLDHSQSFRIVWLLEELKAAGGGSIDYDLKLYQRNQSDRLAPPEYKALSPLGTSPTITTSDGVVLNESNAIIDYILDLAGDNNNELRPSITSPQRSEYLFWFHSVQGTLQPMLTVDVVFLQASKKTPWPISSIVAKVGSKVRDVLVMPRVRALMELAETQLQTNDSYLAGTDSLTAADITAIYPFASIMTRFPEFATTYPKTQAWLDRLTSRPAYKAAQEKVGEQDGIVFQNE